MPEVVIDSNHPALPGHFPGHPVIPAAVILSHVLDAARRAYPAAAIEGIRKVKFAHRLTPGQSFAVEFGPSNNNGMKFVCRQNGTVAVEGRLRCSLRRDDPVTRGHQG